MNASGLLYNLTHHWGFARALRLILGLMMAWQSVLTQEWLVLALALSFAGMALFGIGACNSGACAPQRSSASNTEIDEVEYEEFVEIFDASRICKRRRTCKPVSSPEWAKRTTRRPFQGWIRALAIVAPEPNVVGLFVCGRAQHKLTAVM